MSAASLNMRTRSAFVTRGVADRGQLHRSPRHAGHLWKCLGVSILAIVALAGCGHVTKRTNETTVSKENASSTAETAVASVQQTSVEKRSSGKRVARRTTTSKEGWTVTEELIDEVLQVAATGSARTDHASASATAEKAKTTEVAKATETKRSPWWWSWWFPTALVMGLLMLVVFAFRKTIL